MKVFITGPMTGLPDYNRDGFDKAAKTIEALGHTPLNPYRQDFVDTKRSWGECMLASLLLLLQADAILALEGAENSTGSGIEQVFAARMKLPTVTYRTLANLPTSASQSNVPAHIKMTRYQQHCLARKGRG